VDIRLKLEASSYLTSPYQGSGVELKQISEQSIVWFIIGISLFALGVLITLSLKDQAKRERAKVNTEIERIQVNLQDKITVLEKENISLIPLLVSTSTAQAPSGFVQREAAIAELQQQLTQFSEELQKKKSEIVEVKTIDPIVQATLISGIENLTKRIEAIEKNVLTKWDVATVVLQLLGGFGVILSIVFAFIKFLFPKS
jgi:hypothetical protein